MVSLAKIIGIFINVCIACAASKYDKAINHFSDKGSLLQVEYALKATTLGSPVIAAKACNGDLVIGFQSLDVTRSLLDRRSVNKLAKVDDNTWVAFSGLSGDGDALIKEARIFSISYASTFGVGPSVGAVARYIASIQHKITLSGAKRPYGVCLLFFGKGSSTLDRPIDLFQCQPTGQFSQWEAIAIGSGASAHTAALANKWTKEMTVDEVVRMIKKILMETKIMKINDDKDISSAFTLFHVSPSKNGNDLSIDQYE